MRLPECRAVVVDGSRGSGHDSKVRDELHRARMPAGVPIHPPAVVPGLGVHGHPAGRVSDIGSITLHGLRDGEVVGGDPERPYLCVGERRVELQP